MLFDGEVQFSSITGLQLVLGMENSLALSEQPFALKKIARTLTQNDNRASADSSETDESDNDEYDSDAIDSGGEDDSSDVILAFINSDEEDANERPNATRSGRAITR